MPRCEQYKVTYYCMWGIDCKKLGQDSHLAFYYNLLTAEELYMYFRKRFDHLLITRFHFQVQINLVDKMSTRNL